MTMVYLLHSTVALGTAGRNSARHYLGYCAENDLAKRIREHTTGVSDAAIIRAFRERGGKLLLAGVWPGKTRKDERRMKDNGHLAKLCFHCNPKLTQRER